MEKIIQILIERDGYTREEAEDYLKSIRQMMEDCLYDVDECESIFMEEIGLEPDYLIDFLFEK